MSRSLLRAVCRCFSLLYFCSEIACGNSAGNEKLFLDEIMMVMMYSFADLNMRNWPPTNSTLYNACGSIVAGHKAGADPFATLKGFMGEWAGAFATAAAVPTSVQKRSAVAYLTSLFDRLRGVAGPPSVGRLRGGARGASIWAGSCLPVTTRRLARGTGAALARAATARCGTLRRKFLCLPVCASNLPLRVPF